LRLQVGDLLVSQLEDEVRREALTVAADLFVESASLDAVEYAKSLSSSTLTAQGEDRLCDVLDGDERSGFTLWHWLLAWQGIARITVLLGTGRSLRPVRLRLICSLSRLVGGTA